jgi:DNA-binding winged helix-turn-helix (wHTH) protein
MEEQARTGRFRIGGLLIDLERSSVRGKASASDLTPRAEALLLLLARSANEVVTSEEILQTVWAGRVVEEAVISNCVWQIRKALGPEGKDILQNRAKRGYVLVVPPEAWVAAEGGSKPTPGDAAQAPVAESPETFPDGALAGDRFSNDRVFNTADADPPATPATAQPAEQTNERPKNEVSTAGVAPPIEGSGHRFVKLAQRWPILRWPGIRPPILGRLVLGRSILVAVVVCIVVGVSLWRWGGGRSGAASAIVLSPEADMTVSIVVPTQGQWLRSALLTTIVEEAYLRDGRVSLFEKPQTRNPFAGPHIEIVAPSQQADVVEMQFVLRHGENEFSERFRGSPQQSVLAARAFVKKHLAPAPRQSSAAFDEFVAGVVADLLRDPQTAILQYERALSRDPQLIEATLAMAALENSLGRTRQSLHALRTLGGREGLTREQRCRREQMIADIDPSLIDGQTCKSASQTKKEKSWNARGLLRDLEVGAESKLGARQWLAAERLAIRAHIDLQEYKRAEDRIAEAERIATEAGWEYGRADIAVLRPLLAENNGRIAEMLRLETASMKEYERLKDLNSMIEMRASLALRTPLPPGPLVEKQRQEMWRTIDTARKIGSPFGEIQALRVLLRLDRDRYDQWQAHIDRIEQLAGQWYAPRKHIEQRIYSLDEWVLQRRFSQAIAGVKEVERDGGTFSQAKLWTLTTLAEAHFYRDEFGDAIAAIEAMKKENFDIAFTHPCVFAWLFVEADQPDQFATMLKKCQYQSYDSAARATRGDYGLLAVARNKMQAGQFGQAWAELRPRIDDLLAIPEPTRQEAAALMLLARHAAAAPQADRGTLVRALRKVEPLAGRDGAGPGLRFGIHTLRWRLCMADGRTDCGPPLPEWAKEDRLEARLAAEYAESLRGAR